MMTPMILLSHCYRAIPASALDEDEDDDDDEVVGDTRDDERSGTRYNVCASPSSG